MVVIMPVGLGQAAIVDMTGQLAHQARHFTFEPVDQVDMVDETCELLPGGVRQSGCLLLYGSDSGVELRPFEQCAVDAIQ